MTMRGWAVLGLIAALGGCASMNKEECLYADWQQIGYEEGLKGNDQHRFSTFRQDCAEHGVAPDLAAFQSGHAAGAAQFCTPSNGYQQGRRGYQYQGICPLDQEDEFLDNYHVGRQIYLAESEVKSTQSKINYNERSIDKIRDEISVLENSLFADHVDENERRRIYASISEKKEKLGALANQQQQLLIELGSARAELETVIRESDGRF